MGKTYQFECELCQYRVRVAGGADEGMNCEVQTVTCRECRELFDVFTRVRRRTAAAAKFKTLRPETPPVLLREFSLPPPEWKKIEPACPVSAQHHVEPWNNPGRCPRCGCWLERSGLPWRIWD